MPRLIDTEAAGSIELAELVDMLETGPFDPEDEDCFASWGPALRKLANNRRFLADLVIAELKDRVRGQLRDNCYTPQVIMLHGRSRAFAIRANLWPAATDSIVYNSGASPFFYNVPHDHNFSFLTVGYLGPGYWSEYWEYDHERVTGFTGEKVELRSTGKSRLHEGKVMLYRAHRDVHNQLPADSMSVSINILANSMSHRMRDQYRFDTASGRIHGIINRIEIEPLLALSAYFGGEAGRDLLEDFSARHPSDRVRFLALKARASAAAGLDERIGMFEEGARSGNPFVAAMSAREAGKLEKGRAWIEGPPLRPMG